MSVRLNADCTKKGFIWAMGMQVHASTAIMCGMYSGQCECRLTNMQLYTNMLKQARKLQDAQAEKLTSLQANKSTS